MNRFISDLINNEHIFFTFIRAQLSSVLSALIDLGSRVICYSLIFNSLDEYYRSNMSVATGAVLGGVVQCIVNYHFTFHAREQKPIKVGLKFVFVWIGNLLLNMYSTTYMLDKVVIWIRINEIHISEDILFTIITFLIAIVVSIIWNFPMQRYFVYRKR